MKFIKRIKTLGLVAVMTFGALLSSFSGITASADTMNKTYFKARTGDGYNVVKASNGTSITPDIHTGYMAKEYQYMIQTTNKTQVSVTVNNVINTGQSSIDKGSYTGNSEYKKFWKLQDSWKGNITATYSHCGYYRGTEIDVKLTLMDWEFLYNNQSRGNENITSDDASNIYISFPGKNIHSDSTTNKIGVSAWYCSWIKVKYNFVKSGTNTPVNVKGYTTFNDIDACQGVHFIANYDDILTTNTSANLSCTLLNNSPYIFDGSLGIDGTGTASNDNDKAHWVTSTFSGTNMTVAFTFGLNSKISGTDQVRGGSGTIINYNKKAVRSELNDPEKTVSDSDEKNQTSNTLIGRETFTYKISHYIASEIEENWYNTYTIRDIISADLDVQNISIYKDDGTNLTNNWTINSNKLGSGETQITASHNAHSEDFYGHTYILIITVCLKDSVDISSSNYKITNNASITVSGTDWNYSNTVTTRVKPQSPSISKYINTIGNESYSLHNNSEDIVYIGYIYAGDTKPYSSVEIKDTLADGLTYKSLLLFQMNDTKDNISKSITSYAINNSNGSNISFKINNDKLSSIFNKTLMYIITVTADKTYDGSSTSNEIIPNTISLTVDGKDFKSNTPKLYRSGVNVPEKSVDKSEITKKTEVVTYTISDVVDNKTQEYYYNSYVLSDKLEDVLEIKSTKVLNEDGADVSELFTITENDNTVTATANDTFTASFYGHTYKLVIETSLTPNADLSEYYNNGKAVIPNTSVLNVDGNDYMSNMVEFSYNQISKSSVDKRIINSNNEKVENTQLNGSTVKYTGSATIQNMESVKSVVLSDKLNGNLKYKNISISLNGDDITDWGNVNYDNSSNTVRFTFDENRVSFLAGETIEYTLTCEYIGEYSNKDIEIPNTVTLSVNNKLVESNTPKLYISGVNDPIKSIDKSEVSNKTEAITYIISNVVDNKTQEYFYNSYVISDTLEDVFEVKSTKILNEDGSDVSGLFDITEKNNTITATAKNTTMTSFYGHTYKLVIKASLIQNADLSKYYKNDKAVVPNTSKLIVNGKDYQSNTVILSYKPKSNEVDKYIINLDGEKSKKAELFDDTVTYSGSAVIQDKTTVKSIILSDKLDRNLQYKSISITLDSDDISDWGTVDYDKTSNTVNFTFNSDKISSLAGKTIEYTLICDFVGELSNKSISISNIMVLKVNEVSKHSEETILTTPVDPSITKYISENKESYSLHKNSEDITYTGTIIPGTRLKSKLSIKDNLADGLTYKSLKIFSENGQDITSYGTNTSSGSNVSFVFIDDRIPEIYNTILRYELVVTATKIYDGSATKNEETPNTILLIVEDNTVESNTPKLYRSGVNVPEKSVDKSEITKKTEVVTYTVSNVVDNKTQEYFYNSYVISDTLEDVLEIKSTNILNEDGTDVSELFNITVNGNNIMAAAKNVAVESFYGHTYNLVIQTGIIDKNTDISDYCNKDGKAVIPNVSTLTVDGNVYPSNTVNFTYQPKSNSVDKYILNLNGEKSTESQLYDNIVTYTGNAVIKDSETVKSIVLSDKLDSNLKYREMKVFLDNEDITNWGKITYDQDINTAAFSFNEDVFSSVVGETIEYTLTCEYIGKYSDKRKDVSNITELTVNEEKKPSNDTDLKIPVDSHITKHIYNGDELVNEYTLSADRKDNKIYYEGSILVSEKEPINNIIFSDKLDSNLDFVSISFLANNKEIKCNTEYENGIVKSTLSSDSLKELEGKVIQWKMTCNYVGEEKPTETVTIPNTANVKINDDFYGSNEVKAYVSMVSAYEVTQTTAVPKTTIFKATKQSKITSVANVAQSTQPYTGSKSRKALIFIFAGVLVGATIGAVYRFRKIKKDGKDIIKINKN